MTWWPVIIRELRTEARRPFNFWLRLLGAGSITLVFAVSMLNQSESSAGLGARLFGNLNATLFLAIWVLVPLLTADCISQEKREGTLGLLFLTRLTASGVVVAKSLIHALRSATLLLGMVPVLSVPFVLGGVSWKDGLLALLLNSSALLLGLAAGLMASTVSRDWVRALMLALLISFAFSGVFMLLHYFGYTWSEIRLGRPRNWGAPTFSQYWQWFSSRDPLSQWVEVFSVCTNLREDNPYSRFHPMGLSGGGAWSQAWAVQPVAFQRAWFGCAAILLCLSALVLFVSIRLAALFIRRFWRDEPPSPATRWLLDVFCTPTFWRPLFQHRMTRTLNRNPIGWLQQHSWGDRLTKWGWCFLAVMIECALVSDSSLTWLWTGQYVLAHVLLLGLAFTAAGSFRREQQTGALELLLVTPLNERQIIGGRVRGIWNQFLPAALVVTSAWLWLAKDARWFAASGYNPGDDWRLLGFPIFFVSTYLTLPVVGLCFSMRRLNFIAAWVFTCLAGLLLPQLTYAALAGFAGLTNAIYGLLLAQLGGALGAWLFLHRDLNRRSFSFLR